VLLHLCLSFDESEHLVHSSLPFAMIAYQRQQQANQLWSHSFPAMNSFMEPPRHNLLSLFFCLGPSSTGKENLFCIYMRHF
jgi:hypothetical protein